MDRWTGWNFMQERVQIHADSSVPYSFVWRPTIRGTITLTARAYDFDGGVTTSAPVTSTRKVVCLRSISASNSRCLQKVFATFAHAVQVSTPALSLCSASGMTHAKPRVEARFNAN